jgi:hypothetical protein
MVETSPHNEGRCHPKYVFHLMLLDSRCEAYP